MKRELSLLIFTVIDYAGVYTLKYHSITEEWK